MALVFMHRVTNWGSNMVPFIKALRTANGSDLRTSKEIADTLKHTDAEIEICDPQVDMFLRNIRLLGMSAEITGPADISPYRDELQSIASVALLAGDIGIAKDIINLLLRYEGTKT